MGKVTVSDHALVRWLERVGGIDMDYFRDHISSLVEDAANAGFSCVTIDGFTYTMSPEKNKVVTVLENDWRPKRVKVKFRPDNKYGDRCDDELSYLDCDADE